MKQSKIVIILILLYSFSFGYESILKGLEGLPDKPSHSRYEYVISYDEGSSGSQGFIFNSGDSAAVWYRPVTDALVLGTNIFFPSECELVEQDVIINVRKVTDFWNGVYDFTMYSQDVAVDGSSFNGWLGDIVASYTLSLEISDLNQWLEIRFDIPVDIGTNDFAIEIVGDYGGDAADLIFYNGVNGSGIPYNHGFKFYNGGHDGNGTTYCDVGCWVPRLNFAVDAIVDYYGPDCNGVWGGDAYEDNCGTCDNDSSNDCVMDCVGIWGGTQSVDDYGNCAQLSITNVDTDAGTLDIYMINEIEVSGFQFQLFGINITDASNGLAAEYFDLISWNYNPNDGYSLILATSLTEPGISVIPIGEGLLIQISFTDYGGDDICFGEDTGSAGYNVIGDADANYVSTSWGDCYTPTDPPECNLGDINCDGELNILDIVSLVNIIMDDGEYTEYGDVNDDGYLNILDVVTLVNWVLYGDDGACIDIDGNVYETVQIGEQLWMAENLKVTHYNNEDEIAYPSDEDWGSFNEGQYGVYDNDSSNAVIYGNLYNWYTVDDDRGVCPGGWHVPSDDEYTILTDYLGGESVAGGTLKDTGTIEDGDGLWYSPNEGASNESGFTGLPAGYRYFNSGYYYSMGSSGYFWSSSEFNSSKSWFRALSYSSSNVHRDGTNKQRGLSIRCLQD